MHCSIFCCHRLYPVLLLLLQQERERASTGMPRSFPRSHSTTDFIWRIIFHGASEVGSDGSWIEASI
jgi:hypothetical protein